MRLSGTRLSGRRSLRLLRKSRNRRFGFVCSSWRTTVRLGRQRQSTRFDQLSSTVTSPKGVTAPLPTPPTSFCQ